MADSIPQEDGAREGEAIPHETITALAALFQYGMQQSGIVALHYAEALVEKIAANAIPGVCLAGELRAMALEASALRVQRDENIDDWAAMKSERDAALGRYADAVLEVGRLKAECAGLRTRFDDLCGIVGEAWAHSEQYGHPWDEEFCDRVTVLVDGTPLPNRAAPAPAAERGGSQ